MLSIKYGKTILVHHYLRVRKIRENVNNYIEKYEDRLWVVTRWLLMKIWLTDDYLTL